jgi:hypothetical protein
MIKFKSEIKLMNFGHATVIAYFCLRLQVLKNFVLSVHYCSYK